MMVQRAIEKRWVDNPMLTDGLVEGARAGEVSPALMIEADIDMRLVVGGLARVAGVTPAQRHAAALYRTLWEGAQIGGVGAIDYARVRGDTSGPGVGAALAGRREDALSGYGAAVRALGLVQSRLVELVVCGEASVRAAARVLEGSDGGAAQERVRSRLLVAVEVLVLHFSLVKAAEERRARVRVEGEAPSVFTGEVSTRRRS